MAISMNGVCDTASVERNVYTLIYSADVERCFVCIVYANSDVLAGSLSKVYKTLYFPLRVGFLPAVL